MRVRFASRAVSDLGAADRYYGAISRDLSLRFRQDLDTAVERVIMFPQGAPPVDGFEGLRRARMRRFPFGIFYRPQEGEVVVVRVLHTKRDQLESL